MITVILIVLCAMILWCALMLLRALYRHACREVVSRTVTEDGMELELNDGSRWRSSYGIVWHSFPHGRRASLDLELFLSRENDRLKLIEKWSEDH